MVGGPYRSARDAADLGEVVHRYGRATLPELLRQQARYLGWFGAVSTVAFVVALAGVLGGAAWVLPVYVWITGSIVAIVGALFVVGIAGWLWSDVPRVTIRQNGIEIERRRATFRSTWDDVESVRFSSVRVVIVQGVSETEQGRLTFRRNDGESITVDESVADLESVALSALRGTQFPIAKRLALKVLDEGEAIQFGAVALTALGVVTRRRLIRWSQLDRTEVADGTLRVHPRDGDTITVPLGDVENAHVVSALAQVLAKRAAAA